MSLHKKYKYHIFFCTNKREEGHPRGCCADKSSLKLRNIMKIKTKELGLKNISCLLYTSPSPRDRG